MSLTKETDFKGLYFIPNATDEAPLSNLLGNKTEILEYADQYEREALDILLGVELTDLLVPELLKEPFVSGATDTADAKWVNLVNGTGAYKGLREALVAYTFYKFYEDDHTQYTGVGTVQLEAKNSVVKDPTERAIKVWRRFYELTIGDFQKVRTIVRPIGVGLVWGSTGSPYDSLYTFLKENEETYPEWEPTYFENRNQYGI